MFLDFNSLFPWEFLQKLMPVISDFYFVSSQFNSVISLILCQLLHSIVTLDTPIKSLNFYKVLSSIYSFVDKKKSFSSIFFFHFSYQNQSLKSFVFVGLKSGEGNGTPLQYSCLENPMDGGAWQAAVHGVAKSRTRLNDFTFTFHFHALDKEMATHSSIIAWRIPGTEEPGGLLSMGSHRV